MRSLRSILFKNLAWFILINFAIVLVVFYFLLQRASREIIAHETSAHLTHLVDNIQENYQAQLAILYRLSSVEGFKPFTEAKAKALVHDFLLYNDVYHTIHFYKVNGDLVFSDHAPDFPEYHTKKNFYEKDDTGYIELAKQTIKEKRPIMSAVFHSPAKKRPYQVYIVPVFAPDSEEVLGILSGGIFLPIPRLDNLLNGLTLSDDNFIVVSDKRGEPLMQYGPATEHGNPIAGLSDHIRSAWQIFGDSQATGVYDNSSGVSDKSTLFFSKPLSNNEVLVTIGVNPKMIYSLQGQLKFYFLGGFALTFLAALIMSAILTNGLRGPITEVTVTLESLNKGIFSRRAHVKGNDELAQMGNLVNRLAEKIERDQIVGMLWSNEDDMKTDLERH